MFSLTKGELKFGILFASLVSFSFVLLLHSSYVHSCVHLGTHGNPYSLSHIRNTGRRLLEDFNNRAPEAIARKLDAVPLCNFSWLL
jgi:hypothetical protein